MSVVLNWFFGNFVFLDTSNSRSSGRLQPSRPYISGRASLFSQGTCSHRPAKSFHFQGNSSVPFRWSRWVHGYLFIFSEYQIILIQTFNILLRKDKYLKSYFAFKGVFISVIFVVFSQIKCLYKYIT